MAHIRGINWLETLDFSFVAETRQVWIINILKKKQGKIRFDRKTIDGLGVYS